MMGPAGIDRVVDRHGMAQLADDQTAHQQENQGPALPEKLTHGERVQSDAASRNDRVACLGSAQQFTFGRFPYIASAGAESHPRHYASCELADATQPELAQSRHVHWEHKPLGVLS